MRKDIAKQAREADNRQKDKPITASLSIQGKVLEYKIHHYRTSLKLNPRGDIMDVSDASRLRMLKNLLRVDFTYPKKPLFVTLTYPDELATPDLEQRNIHRKRIAYELERFTGQTVPAVWRIEWVERKSGLHIGKPCPHWHLLIFKIGYIPYAAINDLWRKVIGCTGYVRTEIKRVDEKGSIQGYMAKYISKEALPPSLVIAAYQNKLGRSYGWLRKKEIPWMTEQRIRDLPDSLRERLTDFASERLPIVRSGQETSWTLLGDDVKDAQKIIDGKDLTDPE